MSTITPVISLHVTQASQLGVYKAFVDNYKVALETAEKCSHANIQFQKISEVRLHRDATTLFTKSLNWIPLYKISLFTHSQGLLCPKCKTLLKQEDL